MWRLTSYVLAPTISSRSNSYLLDRLRMTGSLKEGFI
jgi:hypothetical protein